MGGKRLRRLRRINPEDFIKKYPKKNIKIKDEITMWDYISLFIMIFCLFFSLYLCYRDAHA